MIKRVRVSDWRGLGKREFEFGEGLNILWGGNERGKSSLIEAIEKALYWDHRAHATAAMKLREIAPVGVPNARPTVELDLSFPDCEVTVKKVVTHESTKRECGLVIHRPGRSQEVLADREAHSRLQTLLAAHSGAADGSRLGLSLQGRGAELLSDGLPGVAREALHVNEAGAIAPTARLQTVRTAVDRVCNQDLVQRLKDTVPSSLRENSEAQGLWRQIQEKQKEKQELDQIRNEVSELRQRLEQLQADLRDSDPQVHNANLELERLRSRQKQQKDEDSRVLAAKNGETTIARQLDALECQVNSIERLRKEINQEVRSVEDIQADLEKARNAAGAVKRQLEEANRNHIEADTRLKIARDRQTAAVAQHEVLRYQKEHDGILAKLELLKAADLAVATAKAAVEELPPFASSEQIGEWRDQFADLQQFRREAAEKLQVEINLEQPTILRWSADSTEEQEQAVTPDRPARLNAVRALSIAVPGIGVLRIRSGAAELDELLDSIAEQEQALNNCLAAYALTTRELPAGFARLEERLAAGRKVADDLQRMKQNLKDQEKALGSRSALRKQLQVTVQHLTLAQERLIPLAALVPSAISGEALRQEIERAGSEVDEREWEVGSTQSELNELTAQFHCEQNKIIKLETTEQQCLPQIKLKKADLEQLLSDGLTDEERANKLQQSRGVAVLASQQVRESERKRAELGEAVRDSEIEALEKNTEKLRDLASTNQNEITRLRTQLEERCGRDPEGEIERLEEELRELRPRFAAEERRLQAHLILQSLLRAEQQRLGRLLGEPLNQRISPWLQQIRGVPTRVYLEEKDLRITEVITQRNGRDEGLPFAELSDGCREQLAFVIRLVIAGLLTERTSRMRPFVILDDPLTHTDRHRRPNLYRVLAQAGERLQILFVTCHEETLLSLPAAAHRVQV